MKRTMNRLFARLAMFVVAIILGAIAVAQAHKGLDKRRQAAEPQLASQTAPDTVASQGFAAPIPMDTAATPPDAAAPSAQALASAFAEPAEAPAYNASPDPGFDDQPVAYQDTPAYQQEVQSPAPVQPPAPVQNAYAEANYDSAPAYGAESEPMGYGNDPHGPPPAQVQMTGGQDDQAEYEYAYEPQVTPNDSMVERPAAADAGGYGARPVQYAPSSEAGDSGFGPPAPMTLSTEPDYAPAEAATTPDPGYAEQPYDDGYGADAGYGQDPGYGSASVSISEPRTRSVPAYAAPNSPNPSFADEGQASPQPFRQAMNNSFTDMRGGNSALDMGGSGKPGPQELEGTQAPSLTVSKSSPPEVQVGKPATFTVTIKNVGSVAAHDVLIRDEVPHGTRLVDTSPPASQAADGALLWEMGTLEAGAQVSVTMEIMPLEEGEVGSVATVSFQTSASSRSLSTRPELVLEHSTERQVLVGDDVIFRIKLSNNGTGAATGVRVEEDVPEGLRHYEGRELEFEIGTLRPQETRLLELKLKADHPGPVTNVLVCRADGDTVVSDQIELEVVAPNLQVAIEGPRRRYLERRATHTIALANPGTAPARNVNLVAKLPRALKFVNTNNAGHYDSAAHAVRWSLDELPAQEMGKVELTTTPIEMGEHTIHVSSQADMNLEASAQHDIFVDGLAALLFTVTDVSDPIEVGGQTTYEVHVVNQGSKTATNLRLMAQIPAGMQAINGDGPTRAAVEGQRVVFDPLARLAPQSDSFYKIHVKGTVPGDQRIRVLLTSDELHEPVTKEESTHVYSDE